MALLAPRMLLPPEPPPPPDPPKPLDLSDSSLSHGCSLVIDDVAFWLLWWAGFSGSSSTGLLSVIGTETVSGFHRRTLSPLTTIPHLLSICSAVSLPLGPPEATPHLDPQVISPELPSLLLANLKIQKVLLLHFASPETAPSSCCHRGFSVAVLGQAFVDMRKWISFWARPTSFPLWGGSIHFRFVDSSVIWPFWRAYLAYPFSPDSSFLESSCILKYHDNNLDSLKLKAFSNPVSLPRNEVYLFLKLKIIRFNISTVGSQSPSGTNI